MKKIVCFFAHPDDESFGPSGTIAKLARNHDVYIICATRGDAGENKTTYSDLGKVREEEARKSAKLLGVKKIYFLEFKDGCLCNELYHKIADQAETILNKIKPDTLLTFEQHGVSGHIDHIVISMVSSYLFEHISYIKKIMYYCITKQRRALIKDYFIYFPPGHDGSKIDEIVDVADVWDKKILAVKNHKSQSSDIKRILGYLKQSPKEEHFLIRTK